jgi:tetratricopeptide (TPR) repeat protein
VQAILTGRILQRGQDLTLYVELIDALTENVLWKDNYARSMSNLVSLQSDIAKDVSNKLKTKLSGVDEQQVTKNYTENNEAYQLYLKGRFSWNKRSPEGFGKAIEYFKQAITLDPNYALAYSGLADSYSLLPIYDNNVKPKETMPQAREAALKALALDDNLAEAHASLGVIFDIYDWNSAEAIKHYRRAIELNPNFATGYRWLGDRLVADGRLDEGLLEIRRSIELDPFSIPSNTSLIGSLNYARRYDEAIIQAQKTLELDPNFRTANYTLYEVNANKGMYREAVAAYLKQIASDGDLSRAEGAKEAFAKNGWQGFLRREAVYLEKQPQAFPQDIAQLYARLGAKDETLKWLEKAYEERRESITWLKVDTAYDVLHDDPRFQDLIRRVGFPQ